MKIFINSFLVLQFLDDLEGRLRPVGTKDRETLLAMKEKEHAELGLPFDGEFYIWDYRYVLCASNDKRNAKSDTKVL